VEFKVQGSYADDLNSSAALGVLNLAIVDSALDVCEKAALASDFDRILGLNLLQKTEKPAKVHSAEEMVKVEALIERRNEARKNKNFVESDNLRDELLSMGVVIKDSKEDTVWEWE